MSNVAFINDDLREIFADLPSSYATRWNAARKAAVVRAVRAGVLTFEKAKAIYRLSSAEFYSWQRLFDTEGADELLAKAARGNDSVPELPLRQAEIA